MPEKSPSTIISQVVKDIINVRDLLDEAQSLKNRLDVVNFDDKCELKEVVGDTKSIVVRIQEEVIRINSCFGTFYDSWKMNNDVETDTNKPEENLKKSKFSTMEIENADANSCTQSDMEVNKDVNNEIESDKETNDIRKAKKHEIGDKINRNDSIMKCNSNLEKNNAHRKDSDANLDMNNDDEEDKDCAKNKEDSSNEEKQDTEDTGSDSIINDTFHSESSNDEAYEDPVSNKNNKTNTDGGKRLENPVEKGNGKITNVNNVDDADNTTNVDTDKCEVKSDIPKNSEGTGDELITKDTSNDETNTKNESTSAKDKNLHDIDSNTNTEKNAADTVEEKSKKSKNLKDIDTIDEDEGDLTAHEPATTKSANTDDSVEKGHENKTKASEAATDSSNETKENAANNEGVDADDDEDNSIITTEDNERGISKNQSYKHGKDDVVQCSKKSKKSSTHEDNDEINGNTEDEPNGVDDTIMKDKNVAENLEDSVERGKKKKSKNLDLLTIDTSSSEENPTGQDEPTDANGSNLDDSVEKHIIDRGNVAKDVSDSNDQSEENAANKKDSTAGDEDDNCIVPTKDNEREISEKENCKDKGVDDDKCNRNNKKSCNDEINGKDTSEEETVTRDKKQQKHKTRKRSSDLKRVDSDEIDSSSSDKETAKKSKKDSTKTANDRSNSVEEIVSSKDKNENISSTEIKTEWKIKCVDINKLIDMSILNEDSLSSSVVVISDSDTESPLVKNKSQNKKLKEHEPKLISSFRSSNQAKKVINLDDSDTSVEDLNSKKEQPGILRRSTKKNLRTTHGSRSTTRRSVTFNDKHVQSTSEDENTRSRNRASRNKKAPQDYVDVSSLSDCSTSNSDGDGKMKKRDHKKKKSKSDRRDSLEKLMIKAQEDKKFSWKSYVPLPIVPAKRLKENYEKKMLKTQIKRLTKMDSLKRSRSEKSGSHSSSDSISKVGKKRSKKDQSKKKGTSTDSDSKDSGSEVDNTVPCDNLDDADIGSKNIVNTLDDASKILLSNIHSVSDSPICTSGDDDSDDKDGNSKKKGKNANEEQAQSKEKSSKKSNINSGSDSSTDNSDEKDGNSKKKGKENKKNKGSDSESDSNREKKQWRKDKLLSGKLSESDSDEKFDKFTKKKNKLMEMTSDTDDITPKKIIARKKRAKKAISDSDDSPSVKKSDSSSSSSDSSDSEAEKEIKTKKKGRSRIKRLKDSSEEEEDKSTRKNIRKVWNRDSLEETTIRAEKEEQERKARIAERQKKYNLIFEPDALEKAAVDRVVLDFNEETKEELLKVDDDLVKHLKPHQAKGIQFMWDTCYESLERAKSTKGSGCILAHCMGLGKTLQVITLAHTLIRNWKKTGVEKILVVAPLSTVLNWVAEFKKWLPDSDSLEIFEIASFKSNYERQYQVTEWYRCGGVLIMGYDMFRNLTNPNNKRMSKKMRATFHSSLVDPGPHLVICDEGHLLKNEKSSISIAMNRLQTLRRIVLTGTPLQNNLKEYFCMVHFVKPSLLGTFKEYLNRFVNPITNGQYTDSTPHDIQIMRKRSHVLHKLLDGVVQRKDYSVLAPYLPPKYEYVLFVSLTEMQIKLYEFYLKEKAKQPQQNKRSSFLFIDFQELQRICTHPRVLLNKSIKAMQDRDKKDFDEDSEGSLRDFIDDKDGKTTSESSASSSSGSESDENGKKNVASKSKRITRATASTITLSEEEEEAEPQEMEWFHQFCSEDDFDNLAHSGKLSLLFEIIRQAESIGDKVLVFSQSLYSLTIIEYFLNKVDEATQQGKSDGFCGYSGSWALGLDYFRLDGSSSCDNRASWCKTFNNPNNIRARLFLISTRAGGLGINLVAANRVIIFDVSWNPSHDIQSIYRVYRFGQTKPSFVYRFVAMGSMEMKVYERQVIKQSISKRVIDEQQIDRHYNQNDIAELYKFDPKPEERPIPLVPKDVLLGELLQNDDKIFKYHEHQSLLENKEDEVLDEAERKAAWEEFENEKKARQYSGTINNTSTQLIVKALTSIVQKDNPEWDVMTAQNVIPTLLTQLEEQIALGDMTMYNRVMNEIRLMQTAEQQKFQEYYRLQQQAYMMRQYQQQLLNNPNAAQFLQQWNQFRPQFNSSNMGTNIPGTSTNSNRRNVLHNNPNEVIDLND